MFCFGLCRIVFVSHPFVSISEILQEKVEYEKKNLFELSSKIVINIKYFNKTVMAYCDGEFINIFFICSVVLEKIVQYCYIMQDVLLLKRDYTICIYIYIYIIGL